MPSFSDLKRGYRNLWDNAKLTRVDDAKNAANRILSHKARYKAVENQTGVPWFWIGCVHMRESSLDFSGVLHNGEPIIGTNRKTVLVPSGRGPFSSWEDAAIDAIELQRLNNVDEWPIERCLFQFEAYNGWGYFGRVASPYVWAGTNHYTKGKYTRDHHFDPNHVDRQIGCAAIMKALVEADKEVYNYLFGNIEIPKETEDDLVSEFKKVIAGLPADVDICVCVNLKKK